MKLFEPAYTLKNLQEKYASLLYFARRLTSVLGYMAVQVRHALYVPTIFFEK
jgi:hypothetical protein